VPIQPRHNREPVPSFIHTHTPGTHHSYPLAQIVTTPFGSALCQRHGRLNTCVLGLGLVAAGGLLFGLGGSVGWHMAARLLEGAGGGCVNVAAFALVMEVSEASGTLTRDMGIQEVMTGIGFITGPATAGLLFPALGLKGMMLVLSLMPVLMGLALLCLLRPQGVGRRRVAFAPFPAATPRHHLNDDSELEIAPGTLAALNSGQDFASSQSTGKAWWMDATVALVALALIGDAANLGFLDLTLSRHLQSLLGLSVRQMGASVSV
jgi:MFS family permease